MDSEQDKEKQENEKDDKQQLPESTSESVVIVNKEELNMDSSEKPTAATAETKYDSDNDEEDDDDKYVYSDDFEDDTGGEETDIEDNEDDVVPSLLMMRQRDPNPVLPPTVTLLETEWGSKVYVVGTAHFSEESQDDVSKTLAAVIPDIVMVELCNSRLSILQLNEEKLIEEAQNMNLEKVRVVIKQSGVLQGIMHLLFLSMSAHLTKQLGMAPGGEFRRAFQEAKKIPGCRIQLGDRPIQITLRRALASLSVWQKIRLAWYLLTTKDPIRIVADTLICGTPLANRVDPDETAPTPAVSSGSTLFANMSNHVTMSKEDVEKCKQKDLLEEMLKEMTGEFPGLSRVFVQERDSFLAHSLKLAAAPLPNPQAGPEAYLPSVVVGVVGLGHVAGIKANWTNPQYDIKEIMKVPEEGIMGKLLRLGFRISLIGVVSLACYRLYTWTVPLIT